MKNVKEITKNVLSELATAMISKDPREWPPTCSAFVYQPQRPSIQKDDSNTENK